MFYRVDGFGQRFPTPDSIDLLGECACSKCTFRYASISQVEAIASGLPAFKDALIEELAEQVNGLNEMCGDIPHFGDVGHKILTV